MSNSDSQPLFPLIAEPISRYFVSGRLRLHFSDYGREGRQRVVLIHGGMDHGRSWDTVASGLCSDFHIQALDLRGHGDSEWATEYSIATFVFDVVQYIKATGGTPLDVVGHSLGGTIALHMAAAFPEFVRRLVVIEGGPFGRRPLQRRPYVEGLRASVSETENALGSRSRYLDINAGAQRLREFNPDLSAIYAAHLATHGMVLHNDGSLRWKYDPAIKAWPPYIFEPAHEQDLMTRVTAPVLLLQGAGIASWEEKGNTRVSPALPPRSEVHSFEDCGHWPHHKRAQEVVSLMQKFLR